ncbi:piggyBac transposable element-derived protein 4-like [Aplysia californica]|uniref:PiggyBac transposable element-derived protein 4-like n=1 Tax=Aplysia californica TaxID=6500 RepID=A0ABM0JQG4_APLCA|nr:piggyBac transposable element-derived protein 4-like [Aplysia californica]
MSDSTSRSGSTVFRQDSDSGQSAPDNASDISWLSWDGNNVQALESEESASPRSTTSSSDEQQPSTSVARRSSSTRTTTATAPRPSARPQPIPATANTFNFDLFDAGDRYVNDWLPDFSQQPGLLVDTENFRCVDFFSLFFSPAVIDLLVTQTNSYAAHCLDPLPATNYYKKRWSDTYREEMQAFIGLQIAMGLNPKPSIDDYWRSFWLVDIHFKQVMSRHRYKLLSAFFHFSDAAQHVPRGQAGYKPLQKIQNFLDLISPSFLTAYYPHQQVSIDESMARFKGRCHFRQYMPDKPTKRGFKCFCKDFFPLPDGKAFTNHLVETLLDGYLDKSHILFCDNFYSSPGLFRELQNRQTGAVGTVVETRKGFPEQLKKVHLPLRKGDDPVFAKAGDLVATAWHDTKRVCLLSTVHSNGVMHKRIRCSKTPGGFRAVQKPILAESYNSYMGGVDHFDQLHRNYHYPHRSYKWYMALYHYVKDMLPRKCTHTV